MNNMFKISATVHFIAQGFQALFLGISWARPLFIGFGFILGASVFGWADQKESAGQAGSFLNMVGNARSQAMGKTGVSTAYDASALYLNPAGLALSSRKNMAAYYSPLLEESSMGSFSYAQPSLSKGTFGLGIVNLRSGSFERRDEQGRSSGNFDQSQLGVLLSHGLYISDSLSIGSGLKYVRQDIDSYSDSGIGLDVGVLVSPLKTLKFGLNVKNLVAPSLTLNESKETFDRELNVGMGWSVTPPLLLALDVVRSGSQSLQPRVGAEWKLNSLLAIRAGANPNELSAGLGFLIGDWGLDYAFGAPLASSDADLPSAMHRVGFKVSFGSDMKEEAMLLVVRKKALKALSDIESQMDAKTSMNSQGILVLAEKLQQAVSCGAFNRPFDLYRAQAYLAYLRNDYSRSAQFFNEALMWDRENKLLKHHLELATTQMKNHQDKENIDAEFKLLKEKYELGSYVEALKHANTILTLDPNHIEAKAFKEDAERQIHEPIDRAYRIARAKFNVGDYFEAIRHLQTVKKLDPTNKMADELMNKAIQTLEKNSLTLANSSPHMNVVELSADVQKSQKLYSQGLFLYSQGKLSEAIKQWESSLRYDPNNILARNAYGRALQELQEQTR